MLRCRYTPLPQAFYEPSAAQVAPALLGQILIRHTPDGPCGGVIVETEAYLAHDAACHGFKGETARNRSMYGPAGHAYVYFIYGNHYCINAVCCPPGIAEAVLVRAIEPTLGCERMWQNRAAPQREALTNGPGKLCQAMAIDRTLDGVPLWDAASPLCLARNPELEAFRLDRGPVVTGRRIGITAATNLPLRFYLAESPCVSQRRPATRRGNG